MHVWILMMQRNLNSLAGSRKHVASSNPSDGRSNGKAGGHTVGQDSPCWHYIEKDECRHKRYPPPKR